MLLRPRYGRSVDDHFAEVASIGAEPHVVEALLLEPKDSVPEKLAFSLTLGEGAQVHLLHGLVKSVHFQEAFDVKSHFLGGLELYFCDLVGPEVAVEQHLDLPAEVLIFVTLLAPGLLDLSLTAEMNGLPGGLALGALKIYQIKLYITFQVRQRVLSELFLLLGEFAVFVFLCVS